MRAKTKNIIRGIGSVMDIAPRSDYRRYIPTKTPAEQMRSHWESVGNSIRRVLVRFQNEQAPTEQAP